MQSTVIFIIISSTFLGFFMNFPISFINYSHLHKQMEGIYVNEVHSSTYAYLAVPQTSTARDRKIVTLEMERCLLGFWCANLRSVKKKVIVNVKLDRYLLGIWCAHPCGVKRKVIVILPINCSNARNKIELWYL